MRGDLQNRVRGDEDEEVDGGRNHHSGSVSNHFDFSDFVGCRIQIV